MESIKYFFMFEDIQAAVFTVSISENDISNLISAFGRTVTESNPLKVRFAKDWIHSWQNLHVLTYFAVNAKYWAELLPIVL